MLCTYLYRLLLSLIFCLVIDMDASAYTERNLLQGRMNFDELKSSLIMGRQWVPFPAYSDREGWDSLLGDSKAACIKRGERRLNYEWKIVKATDYLNFERSGDRQSMAQPFNANRSAVCELLFAELAEGKGRFIDPLIDGIFHFCEMTSWAEPAHLIAQRSRRALPEHKEQVIDLAGGELASMLAWAYYFLHQEFDKVNPEISRRLHYELKRRMLDAYMANDYWWVAANYKSGQLVNNWNVWCNSNVLMCFMLIEDNRDELAKAVYRSMCSVDHFINYTHSDGACEEGSTYWGHAAGKLLDYLDLLSAVTGGKLTLSDEPMIRNMGEFIVRSYVGDGWVVNFADASARGGGDPFLIYRFGKTVNSNDLKEFAALMNQKRPDPLAGVDFYRSLCALTIRGELEQTKPSLRSQNFTWYAETELCYMDDSDGNFLAAKGGYNNESHNHNDAGSFSLWLRRVPIIIDAGVGTYTRQTFSSERYSIWTMKSDYHNLPSINGVLQQYGSAYKATEVEVDRRKRFFKANLATAYPKEAEVKKWMRTYTFKNKRLTILDEFELNRAYSPNRINFMIWGNVHTDTPGEVLIEASGQKAILYYDAKELFVETETIKLPDSRLSNVWGEQIYRVTLVARQLKKKGNYLYTIKEP